MANVASAEKRNRQRLKRRARNLTHLVSMRTVVKRARVALDNPKGGSKAVGESVGEAIKKIARAAQKGVIHKRTASRKISRLMLASNKVASKPVAQTKAAVKAPVKRKKS